MTARAPVSGLRLCGGLTGAGCSVSLSEMAWLLLTFAALGLSVGGVLRNVQKLQAAEDEQEHLRISVRFWMALAGMGFIIPVLLIAPLLGWGILKSLAAQTAAALAMLPPMALVGIGTYNARALQKSLRRRTLALTTGTTARGVVISRRRRSMSSDLMEVFIEADLPRLERAPELAYRSKDAEGTFRHRFIEIFPSDQWRRFEPGAQVEVSYDPKDLEHFAITRVYAPRDALEGAAEVSLALPEAAPGRDDGATL